MKIFIEDPSEWDLKGMLWSGAEKTLEEITDADMYDNFVSYIEEMYDEEGNAVMSAPHPQQILRIRFRRTPGRDFIIRKRK